MKKLLLILMVMQSISMAAQTITEGDFEFRVLSEGDCTAELVRYNGNSSEVTIPSKVGNHDVVSIGISAFSGCELLNSITIPNSVTKIGYEAFSQCTSLSSVTIPNSVTEIDTFAFAGCPLTSVTIPSSVTKMGEGVFCYCTSLNEIIVEADNTHYVSIDGIVYNQDKTVLVACPGGRTSVTIPNSVTKIENSAFRGCSLLSSVTIPNTVTSIGSASFYKCSSLSSIAIPNSVTEIGAASFYECSSLSSATISNTVAAISERLFYNCTSLSSVTIPGSVTSIGYEAFSQCTSLSSVTIPNSVTEIDTFAFAGCPLTSVTIPGSVTKMGEGVFCYCTSLNEIIVEAGNTNYISVDGIVYNQDKTVIEACPGSRTSVTILNSVTEIGNSAFRGCSLLNAVTIPDAVTSIGSCAFYNCTSLSSVTIPNAMTEIGSAAFYNCTSLKEITVYATTPPVATSAFRYVPADAIVYIPQGTYDDYIYAEGWSYFSDFRELPLSLSHPDITMATADGSAPVEHYDLTGVRVDSDALTPGIYIRKQGDKITKILVK